MSVAMATTNPSPGRRFGGSGFIAGQGDGLVTVGGSPSPRKVVMSDRVTGAVVGITYSGPDGTYRFDHLDPERKYVLTAFDHQSVYNAVIRDNITPAVNE